MEPYGIERVQLGDLRDAHVYIAAPITGVSAQPRRELEIASARVQDILSGWRTSEARRLVVHASTDNDLFASTESRAYENYAEAMTRVARASMLIAFLDPPSHGVGMKIHTAAGCNCPTVLCKLVPSNSACLAEHFRQLNRHDQLPDLSPVSWMIRGMSLVRWMPWVVFFNDLPSLCQNMCSFLNSEGEACVRAGVDSVYARRKQWKNVRRALVRRRRVIGLRRNDVATLAGCHPSLLKAIEEDRLVLSTLAHDRIRTLLYPLCLRVESRADNPPESALTLGLAAEEIPPYGPDAYELLKLSHDALREAGNAQCCRLGCQQRGWWDEDWDEAWFEAWQKLNLYPQFWGGSGWLSLREPRRDLGRHETVADSAAPSLFEDIYVDDEDDEEEFALAGMSIDATKLSNLSRMPMSPTEWAGRVSCPHKGRT